MGGDYFDFLNLDGGRLGLIVGDIAGKGMPAIMIRQLDALAMLGVLIIDEETDTEHETAKDGTDVVKKKIYEVYDLNPDFDRDALAEIAAAKPATRAEAEM